MTATDKPLRIALVCFPSVGGSGKIATDLGLCLSRRGHEVHLLSYDRPGWLAAADTSLHVHRIAIPDYPLPHLSAYSLALASQLAELSLRIRFDVWHLHYAIPHLASAYLAAQLLRERNQTPPKILTTLHGTDVTLLGSDPALSLVHRFVLSHSDGLSTPSAYLAETAYSQLGIPRSQPIEVIPNFVDTDSFCPLKVRPDSAARRALLGRWLGEEVTESEARRIKLILHSSNFRPVKRIDDILALMRALLDKLPTSVRVLLMLVGDGPEKPRLKALADELGLSQAVRFLGVQHDFVPLLQHSDVFLLPSALEGFGLSALEALSCGVPVVASRAGGLVEVVEEGQTGFLCPVGDVAEMTRQVLRILTEEGLHDRLAQKARQAVLRKWQAEPIVRSYQALYERLCRP